MWQRHLTQVLGRHREANGSLSLGPGRSTYGVPVYYMLYLNVYDVVLYMCVVIHIYIYIYMHILKEFKWSILHK